MYRHIITSIFSSIGEMHCRMTKKISSSYLAIIWSSPFSFHPRIRDVLAYQSFLGVSPFLSEASLEEETFGVITRLPPRPLLLLAVLTCTLLPRGARDGLFLQKAGK